MELFFRIRSGPRKNDIFKIQKGMTLGRARATVNLKDTKASSNHGMVEQLLNEFHYVDTNSTNGSFSSGKKIDRIKLEPGVIITIGATELEVVTEFDLKKTSHLKLSEWREQIFDLLQKMDPSVAQTPLDVFDRCLHIRVASGNFMGLEWDVAYGPRFLGPGSPDLCLPDNALPSLCLKIFKSGSEIKIESANQKKYVFNGVEKHSETLSDSMTVNLGEHTLEIKII